MRALTSLALAAAMAAGPALARTAQEAGGGLNSPGELGVVATSPSRMDRSRMEMNRDRTQPWTVRSTPAETRARAEQALARGGFVCTIVEAVVVGRVRQGQPLIEVDCAQGGGMIVADVDPILAVDCLDLAPDQGQAGGRNRRVVSGCVLPANVAAVAAANRNGQSGAPAARN